jgi:hypothetical protein
MKNKSSGHGFPYSYTQRIHGKVSNNIPELIKPQLGCGGLIIEVAKSKMRLRFCQTLFVDENNLNEKSQQD